MKNPFRTILFRTVNFYRGSSFRPFGNILRKFYQKHMEEKMQESRTVTAETDGIKYELDLNTSWGLETYYGGEYEPTVTKIIKKYVKPKMTVLDVGANIGLHTFRLKKLVGEKGKVIAVEPNKDVIKIFKRNEKLNNCSVILINYILSDRNIDNEITLDEIVIKLGIDKIDFMKIDTDGWEHRIIRGGLNSLKRFKPIMVIEFNMVSFRNGSLEKMIDLLKSLGYSFFKGKNLKEYSSKQVIFDDVVINKPVNVLCKLKI